MKKILLILLAFVQLQNVCAQSCMTNTLTINTGYNPLTGTAITPGINGGTAVTDPHWVASSITADVTTAIASTTGLVEVTPGSSADVVTTVYGWATNPATNPGQWISCLNSNQYYDDGDASLVLNAVLSRSFRMCGSDSIKFIFHIADDNYVASINIDGIATTFSQPPGVLSTTYSTYAYFTTTLFLTTGTHTINVTTNNYAVSTPSENPTGLDLYGTVSSATGTNSLVSENSTACIAYSCDTTPAPINYISLPDTLYACIGAVDTLHATIIGSDSIISINWTPTTGLSSSTVLDPTLTVSTSGYYYVTVTSLVADNLVVNGDFSAGNTGFTSPDYTYLSSTPYSNEYTITTDEFLGDPGIGVHFYDHTNPPSGNMLFVNGGSPAANTVVWKETVPITGGNQYKFAAWYAYWTYDASGTSNPNLIVKITPVGAGVSSADTFAVLTSEDSWHKQQYFWNAPAGATSVIIQIIDQNAAYSYNDFCLDDISFQPLSVATDSIYIVAHPLPPAPTAGSNSPVCSGHALDLTATDTGGATYHWSGPSSYTSSAENPVINPATTAASGTYSVYATLNGCSSTTTTETLLVDSCETLHLPDSLNACIGSVDTLHASLTGMDSILSIVWSPTTGLSSSTILDPLLTIGTSGYYDISVTALIPDNLVINGNFTAGNTGFSSGYSYVSGPSSLVPASVYAITTNPHLDHPSAYSFGDHTTGTGNMMAINGASTPIDVWCETISVTPYTNYAFSAWFANWSSDTTDNLPLIQFDINGTPLTTGYFSFPGTPGLWTRFYSTWNSGASTTASICIYDAQTAASGNDFAIDDILFEPIVQLNDSIYVTGKPNPPLPILGSNTPICSGHTLDLTATDTTGATYHWSGPSGFTTTIQNPVISPATTAASGTYSVHTTLNGCSSPTVFETVLVDSCESLYLPDSLHACIGNTDILPASLVGTDSIVSINWTPTAGLSSSTVLDPTLAVTTSGWYDIAVTTLTPDNLIENPEFSLGNVDFSSSYNYLTSTPTTPDHYAVGTNPITFYSLWPSFGDHTTGSGNMLIVDGAATTTSFWCESIPVAAGTNYEFSVWTALVAAPLPSIQLTINGTSVGTFAPSTTVGNWVNYTTTWNSGTATTAAICFTDLNTAGDGNDFAIDDISLQPQRILKDSIYVSANSVPPVHLNNDTTFCSGPTIVLHSSDSYTAPTYLWSTGSATASISTGTSGTYWLDVTIGGCTGSDTTVVTVDATPPAPSFAAIAPVCTGNAIDFIVTDTTGTAPPLTFSWSGPDGFTSSLQDPVIDPATLAATGVYSLIVTLNGCLSPMGTIAVLVDSTPSTVTASSNSAICAGDTLRFYASTTTVSPGIAYHWVSPTTGYSSVLQNPQINNATTAASGIYSVMATLNGLCPAGAEVIAVVNPIPVFVADSSNSPVCVGQTLLLYSLFSPTGGTYNWGGPMGFASTINNPNIPDVTLGTAGVYTVSETLNGCTSDTAAITVVVNIPPDVPMASSNTPVCQYDTLQLTASDGTPGVTYSWAGPNLFTATTQNTFIADISPTDAGTYSVFATSGNCTSTSTTLVLVTPAPTLTPTSNSPVCSGDTLLLYANTQTGAVVTWSGPYGFTSLVTNPVRTNALTEYSGVYQARAFLDNCYSYGYAYDTVVINQTPLPPWVSWMTYCQYYPAPPLQANGTNILWYAADSVQSGVIPVPVPPTNVVGSSFYFTTQTVNGCISAIDSIQVTVNPIPTVTVTPDTSICPHTLVTLTASDADLVANYQWYPSLYLNDNNTAVVTSTPETDITYTVVAGNQFGCTDTAYTSIHVYPAALIALDDSVTLSPGENYVMSPATNCTSFSWLPPAGLSSSVISNPVASPDVNTKYVVYGTTVDGCVGSDSISIYISTNSLIAVPNAFTPGNGANSEFKINKKGEVSLNYFRVFNRWGQKVFETTNIDAGWDGTFKGTAQPFDVYVYEIEAVTATGQNFVLHGNVTLLR